MWNKVTAAGSMAAAAAVVVCAVAAPAGAQEIVTASVPFDFAVGKTVLPAGDYMISQASDPFVLTIENRNGSAAALVATVPDAELQEPRQPELVFVRIGDRYRLERIVVDDEHLVRTIPMPAEAAAHHGDRVAVLTHPAGRLGN